MADKKKLYWRGMRLLAGSKLEALRALKEDLRGGDITTARVVGKGVIVAGEICCERDGTLAGVAEAEAVLNRAVVFRKREGAGIRRDEVVARVSGEAGFVFGRIRTALDVLSYMSGIATVVRKAGVPRFVAGTRKTHPGSRFMEKRALEVGGGLSHRTALGDGFLIKKEHLTALACVMGRRKPDARVITEAIRRAGGGSKPVIIEAETVGRAVAAARAGADAVMFDNFPERKLVGAIRMAKAANQGILVEISGGVGVGDLPRLRRAGADVASVSCFYWARPLGFRFEIKKAELRERGKRRKVKNKGRKTKKTESR
ncbi:MAG: hypothetical protein NT157_05065 [Candidatus Micrarchaeota archaeon]|nr:hypothetical protein [Candidatus Micrarchaeota archaeon]